MKNSKFLHPALSLEENILTLGFQVKEYNFEEKKWETKNKYLLSTYSEHTKEITTEIIDQNEFERNNTHYFFDVKTNNKNRILPKLDSRWSEEMLKKIKWDNKVNPQDVYYTILSHYKAHMALEEEADYHILTSWTIMTYLFPIFKAVPYLNLKGMKGTGKTTLLDLLRLLCFNAFKERSTLATLRDKIDSERATALIDQADTRFGTNEKTLSDMLDPLVDSYKASSGVITKSVQTDKNFVRAEYNIFGPKAFAGTKELNFDLKDRCIQIQLIKSLENLPQVDTDKSIWLETRDSLYKLAINHFFEAREIYKELQASYVDDKSIVGRNLELWIPIETILKLCKQSSETLSNVRSSYLQKVGFSEDNLSPMENEIIKYIYSQFVLDEDRWISLKDIVTQLELMLDKSEWENDSARAKSNLAGNLLKKMNLYAERKRTNEGYKYLFRKDRVAKVLNAYKEKDEEPTQDTQPQITSITPTEF